MSEKCSPDDPRRCQGVTPNGQCEYLAGGTSKFCNFHSQGNAERAEKQSHKERYMIDRAEMRQSYHRHADDKDYLSLKDEIVLARAMLERRINMAKNDAEEGLAIRESQGLIQRLESMCVSLMKLQTQLGLVLGKDQLRVLAKEVATILDEELEGIEDKDTRMDRICERLFTAIEEAGRPTETE